MADQQAARVRMRRLAAWARPHWPLLPGLLVGAALRLWGLRPAFLYGDEAEYAAVARSLSRDATALAYPPLEGFGPIPFVSQPPAVLYLDAAAAAAVGAELGPVLVSALLGTATLAVVYAAGVALRDRWLGGMAAGLLAILPFHVQVSRSAQLDAGFTFFAALTLLFFLLWLRAPRLRWSLATGAAAGLTALAKLPGVLFLVPLLAVLAARALPDLLRLRDQRLHAGGDPAARARLRQAGRHVLAAGLPLSALGLAYLLQLWSLRATSDWVAKLGWNAGRVAGEAPGTVPRGWSWYFTADVGLWAQWGFGLVFLAAAGAVLLAVHAARSPRDRWPAVALLAWPVPLAAFLVLSSRKEWFYAMPLTPVAVLLAAWAVHAAARRAWAGSRPAPGDPWWRTPGAVIAVAGLAAVAAFAPLKFTLERRMAGPDYGYGLREAADWIHAQDPGAAQVGTTLGRFSLHFYNGQPTYHYFVNHTWLDRQAESGAVRYVVRDPYLNLTYEREWMDRFVERHGGELAQSFRTGDGRRVEVYRLA